MLLKENTYILNRIICKSFPLYMDFFCIFFKLFLFQVSEAAKRLYLKEHSVLDGSGNVFKLAASVECKGIVGGDDRWFLFWVGLVLSYSLSA